MLKRSITPFSLLLTSVSAILGSGWLFASYYTSKLAGPSAISSWLLGGGAAITIAFVFAELCAMLPITASSIRIPHYTHGTLVSFLFSWIIWISYASLASTEVQAIMQYLNYFYPIFVLSDGALTKYGYLSATLLMLSITILNIFSLRWLLRFNSGLTILKIAIPVIVALIILALYFTPQQLMHPANAVFSPFGLHGIFSAITGGGVVFAFNGFKQACEMAGEAKNPGKALPFAIVGSVAISLIVYLLLQCAFLCSLTPYNLTEGWAQLTLEGSTSPISAIVHQQQLDFLLPLLYVGAIIGPLAAALMYVGSGARALYGMSKNHQIPSLFQRLTTQGNPIAAIITNFILGLCLFAVLRGWDRMITFLTSLIVLTYAVGPICLLALRKQIPDYKRPFKLPFANGWATFVFYICTLLTYWSGWVIISKLIVCLLVGFAVLLIHRYFTDPEKRAPFHWQPSLWIWPYFLGIGLISYFGNFGGGKGFIAFGWDFILFAILCVSVIYLGVRFRLPADLTRQYIEESEFTKSDEDEDEYFIDGIKEPALSQR